MAIVFCVVGADPRQNAAAAALRAAGCTVLPPDRAAEAPNLLLPMTTAESQPESMAAQAAARPGARAFAGRVGPALRGCAAARGVQLYDYYEEPALARLNAVPTAEGCLGLLLQLRDRTIWESPFLVLGYGRVGRAVANRLAALGGRVTVAARAADQRAAARCSGCRAAPLTALPRLLPGFEAVVNTIPAPVLPAALLARLPAGAVIIDLASAPGGVDLAAADALGLCARFAPGLPGRCAPATAGALVADTVLRMLCEQTEGEG